MPKSQKPSNKPKSKPQNKSSSGVASRPPGVPKGYKPTENTHSPNPPKESGSGLKNS